MNLFPRNRKRTVKRPRPNNYRGGAASPAYQNDWAIWLLICQQHNISTDASAAEVSADWAPPADQAPGGYSFDNYGGDSSSSGGSSSSGYSGGGYDYGSPGSSGYSSSGSSYDSGSSGYSSGGYDSGSSGGGY